MPLVQPEWGICGISFHPRCSLFFSPAPSLLPWIFPLFGSCPGPFRDFLRSPHTQHLAGFSSHWPWWYLPWTLPPKNSGPCGFFFFSLSLSLSRFWPVESPELILRPYVWWASDAFGYDWKVTAQAKHPSQGSISLQDVPSKSCTAAHRVGQEIHAGFA